MDGHWSSRPYTYLRYLQSRFDLTESMRDTSALESRPALDKCGGTNNILLYVVSHNIDYATVFPGILLKI